VGKTPAESLPLLLDISETEMLSGKPPQLEYYPETAFGGFTDVDATIRFYTRVHALLKPSFVVADVGCGRGFHAHDPVAFRQDLLTLKGKCRRVIGIDVDDVGNQNPLTDEFRLIQGDRWPLENESVDLCLCQFVLEHLANPETFFSESARVLKEGGFLCVRTPNALGYPALVARLVPNRWHSSILKMIKKASDEKDVFPTLYRCNTVGKLRSMMRRHGFEACVYTHEAEPGYLRFWKPAFALGVLFQRFAPRMFRSAIFGFGRKAASSASATPAEACRPRQCGLDRTKSLESNQASRRVA